MDYDDSTGIEADLDSIVETSVVEEKNKTQL